MKNDGFEEKASSSEFLQQRIRLNQNSTNNFEHWSINTMPKIPLHSNILDLGCGTGKQIESFSGLLPKTCNYVGCDISQESLNVIKENYASLPTLELIHDSFDNMDSFLNKNVEFDLIYSFYALYYTQDLQKLIKDLYAHLKKNGVFWVVMPYKNTNVEIFSILNKIYPIDERVLYSINGFAHDVISIASEINFQDIEISLFENKINFSTESDLLDYVENTTFYDKNFAKEITEEIHNHFKNDFSLTKEVISIKLTK
jgi:ubiquinone/menaquinone biosynthesis C-methylase UbiE